MPDINLAPLAIASVVLLFALTIHEMAPAWTTDRLGDPASRLLLGALMLTGGLDAIVVPPYRLIVSWLPLR